MPVLGKGAETRAKRLREEHMVPGLAESNSGVNKLERRGRMGRAVARGGEELALNGDGAQTEMRLLELTSGSGFGDTLEPVVASSQGEVETREEEPDHEEGLVVGGRNANEARAIRRSRSRGNVEDGPSGWKHNATASEEVPAMRLRESDIAAEVDERRSGM